MKNQNLKKSKFMSLSLVLPKFSREEYVLGILNLFLITLQVFHSYKTYHLGNEFLEVFGKMFFEIKIENLSFLCDVFIIVTENKLDSINNRIFKMTITLFKKLPSVLLLGFIVLICLGYFLLDEFNFSHYFVSSAADYLLHIVVHHFEADKKHKWRVTKNFLSKFF